MFRTIITVLAVMMVGCATARTKSSDPVMRIAIDAKSMPQASYVRLQRALVQSGKFVVVDRANGFRFIDNEQKLQHNTDRFGNDEKYAEWGKMYGVGGVVIGIQNCQLRFGWSGEYFRCMENLSLIDVTTGEAISVAEDMQDTEYRIDNPSWDKAVDQMIDAFPKTFVTRDNLHQTVDYSSSLRDYREQISKHEDRKPASQE
jgi:hypothetical protein